MPRPRALAAGLAVAAALGLVGPWSPLVAGSAAFAEDYPTWDQVEAAKADVASREAEATRIDGLIRGLEVEAALLGDAAVESAARAADAELARQAAADEASRLTAAADAAAAAAEESSRRFGRTAALLARAGGADTTLQLLFASGDSQEASEDPSEVLAGLGLAARVADLYTGVAQRAEVERANAAALRAQADVAAGERDRLAVEAADRAVAAEAAHEAAEAQLAGQRQTLDTLYAQVASLRDRTVDLERRYQVGEQARQEAAAREAAAREAEAAAAGAIGTAPPPPGVIVDPAGAKAYARSAVARYGWGDGEYQCLVLLWTRESSWRADAYNASSGAYGIPQSLPGSKMAAAGADWRTNAATQIEWGLSYISARYGAPCGAWAHSERVNWY
ncbi:hypothetical protein GE115_01005 [Agromyces sp. CFH 90414]|uniref:Lytic transglycosylase domain-containing protein n=1 Tax=Agromyces agglutinans TaxID=2662258 RepID=A0A6I2F1I7_9MICO|nr:hypothetical protein [Agromyces agglutinans]MRG58459.1 hypothetical protein [Agromyces agglutinans]